MAASLFDRIYSYRQRENKNSLENFFIEILAFCLQTDIVFEDRFYQLIDIEKTNDPQVSTQAAYDQGRPDIEIQFDNTHILIECKIEHRERENQLNDYAEILLKGEKSKKLLVYLTKHDDQKTINISDVSFKQLRWASIYKLIDNTCQQVTREFKQYIKHHKMDNTARFDYYDLAALGTIEQTIGKMDEVLSGVKSYFETKLGKLTPDEKRLSGLKYKKYTSSVSKTINEKDAYIINIGFTFYNINDIVIAIYVSIPIKNKSIDSGVLKKHFESTLNGWEAFHWEEAYEYWYYKPLGSFISVEEDHKEQLVNFLKKGIDMIQLFPEK